MDDRQKIWTTVGSAGTLSHADLSNVLLQESVVQLGGTEILHPAPESAYYVEATLTAPLAGVGNPAAISIIKLVASPTG